MLTEDIMAIKEVPTTISENVQFVNLNWDNSNLDLSKFAIQIKKWNMHDWKNLIGFKHLTMWYKFVDSCKHLANFYNSINDKSVTFTIFFKTFTKFNKDEFKSVLGNRIWENYADELEQYLAAGYFFVYFTTQRECYDKNQFISYMLDNHFYFRQMIGHVSADWSKEEEETDMNNTAYFMLNEKW